MWWGDDDQSIYHFRGASPEIMLGFGEDYPETETILLDVNYRSANIVNGALQVISIAIDAIRRSWLRPLIRCLYPCTGSKGCKKKRVSI